mmetsp:Transcript_16575/g.39339  ORF Transcript_16575/g.39339 Transcript_16575/m.39339 type:complete len:290 (+) Transcript_16575:600-1469(+)
MKIRCSRRLRTASSSSCGRFVAPMTTTCASCPETPSNCSRNSVLSRRLASCSPDDRALRMESISSMKITEGAISRATLNSVRTSFSPSPIHRLVSEDAERAKNVHLDSFASARARRVFPLPGGPYSRSPFAGERIPLKRSDRSAGSTTSSCRARLAPPSPAMLSHPTEGLDSITSDRIISLSFCSSPLGAATFGGTGGVAWPGAAALRPSSPAARLTAAGRLGAAAPLPLGSTRDAGTGSRGLSCERYSPMASLHRTKSDRHEPTLEVLIPGLGTSKDSASWHTSRPIW